MNGQPLREECGVFGVFGADKAGANVLAGLSALQHRGQEGCGVATLEPTGRIAVQKGLGLVSQNFPIGSFRDHPGRSAIGHVRYGTSGGGELDNVQPFVFHRDTHDFAVVHNGNIVNTEELKIQLERMGTLFRSSSDSEILGHLVHSLSVGNEGLNSHSLKRALNLIDGAFCFLVLTSDRLYACRDRYGFRPLSLGRLGNGYAVASETCALHAVGAQVLRDVQPGEVLEIGPEGITSSFFAADRRNAMCAMEYIYFARPDSDIEGVNVHTYRVRSGQILFRESPVDADMVIGVPDSGLSGAIGYARASGLPLETGLIKNFYTGRTFIQPNQSLRITGVRMKLTPIRSVVQGKRLVVMDDSIVRGTTSKQIVRMLREAGAAEIHLRITSAPLRHPCYYGVDISTEAELISARMDVDEVCRYIGADSLAFLSEAGMLEAGRRTDLCMACFDDKYPTALYSHDGERDSGSSPE
jgi:amidophosphoribosyltransferase